MESAKASDLGSGGLADLFSKAEFGHVSEGNRSDHAEMLHAAFQKGFQAKAIIEAQAQGEDQSICLSRVKRAKMRGEEMGL